MNKKNILLVFTVVFAVLAFCGIGYIFYTNGEANAGICVIPMVIELFFCGAYRKVKAEEQK